MAPRVYIDGTLVPKEQAVVSVYDHGLLYGDGVFEGIRVYSGRDRTRLKLTLRAKRLGLSLTEAKDIIDMYDSPRDTGPQLRKFLDVLAAHREQVEQQMADLQANLDEVKAHQREARALLTKLDKKNGK